MNKLGQEAMANVFDVKGREVTGRASNGMIFIGFIDSNNQITNYFPTIKN